MPAALLWWQQSGLSFLWENNYVSTRIMGIAKTREEYYNKGKGERGYLNTKES